LHFATDLDGPERPQEARHGPNIMAWALGRGRDIVSQGRAAGCLAPVLFCAAQTQTRDPSPNPGQKKAGAMPAR